MIKMKLKAIKIYFPAAILLIMTVSSCVKNRNPSYTDFSGLTPFLECKNLVIRGGLPVDIAGLTGFDDAENYLAFSPGKDSAKFFFYVNLASVNTLDHDITVTLGPSTTALETYNADPNNTVKFEMLPESFYNWENKTVTIKAGERAVLDSLVIYLGNDIDPKKNYMLPAGIVDGDGIDISGNKGAMYYHVIGNCIAGPSTATGVLDYLDASGNITFTFNIEDFEPDKFIYAVTNDTARVDYSTNGISGWQYIINIDCANDSIINVSPNDIMYSKIKLNSFKDSVADYDAAARTIHLITEYQNSSGSRRMTDEVLKLQ